MKLIIMQFSPTSCHLIPLGSKYSQHPVLKHPQSLALAGDEWSVSRPCRFTPRKPYPVVLKLNTDYLILKFSKEAHIQSPSCSYWMHKVKVVSASCISETTAANSNVCVLHQDYISLNGRITDEW
jgi:hypothetical protein